MFCFVENSNAAHYCTAATNPTLSCYVLARAKAISAVVVNLKHLLAAHIRTRIRGDIPIEVEHSGIRTIIPVTTEDAHSRGNEITPRAATEPTCLNT